MQLFINTYPTSERVKEANRLIDEMRAKLEVKAFAEGELYYDIQQYQAATRVFDNLLKDFPETKNAEKIRYFIVKSNYLLARNSVYEKRAERYEETLERIEEFLDKYPSSQYKNEITDFQDNSVNQLKKLNNVRYKNESARAGS